MRGYLEFEVSLRFIKPRIWRRIQLHGSATFLDLHQAIQDAFGWEDYHLWTFRTPGRPGRVVASVPQDDFLDPDHEDIPDASSVKLTRHFKTAPMNCQYVYDFGDHWVHTVRFRQRVTSAHHFQRRLLAGRRAGPHEDSGGIGGYSRLVEFLATGEDPWGDDPEELAAWIGEWRPDNFALADVRNTFDR